jgi:glycosyltransferase involved in cell wall biosynthesis
MPNRVTTPVDTCKGRAHDTFGLGILPYLSPGAGGLHSYSMSVLDALRGYQPSATKVQVTLVASDEGLLSARGHVAPNWARIALKEPTAWTRAITVLKQTIGEGPHREAWRKLRRERRDSAFTVPAEIPVRPELSNWYRNNSINLMLYTTVEPMLVPAFAVDIPFVVAIHDLQHRLQPQTYDDLPGVARIEYITRNSALRATLVLVDSEVGREDLLDSYYADGLRPERVRVLPYCPPPAFAALDLSETTIGARQQYELPARYLFYLANFWPYKNHIHLIEALALLKSQQWRFGDSQGFSAFCCKASSSTAVAIKIPILRTKTLGNELQLCDAY